MTPDNTIPHCRRPIDINACHTLVLAMQAMQRQVHLVEHQDTGGRSRRHDERSCDGLHRSREAGMPPTLSIPECTYRPWTHCKHSRWIAPGRACCNRAWFLMLAVMWQMWTGQHTHHRHFGVAHCFAARPNHLMLNTLCTVATSMQGAVLTTMRCSVNSVSGGTT